MNPPETPPDAPAPETSGIGGESMLSALFASMVMQQTNMALMLLGKVPSPETGKPVYDTDAAQMMIDQLAMLEVKTKGNLDEQESHLLRNSLMTLRMAFVEAIDRQPPAGEAESAPKP
jgi:hypothetical protein